MQIPRVRFSPLLAGLAAICALPSQAEAAEFSFDKGESLDIITIVGEFQPGDEDHFRRLAIGSDEAIVVLSSPGGALAPALGIGKTIQLKGFSTLVPSGSECSSACALVWVAGVQRFAGNSSRIGFHASYRDNNGRLEEVGVANAVIGRYLTLLNLSEKAVIFATSASPSSILWLDANLARSIGMEFETIDGDDSEPISPTPREGLLAERDDGAFEWEHGAWGVDLPPAGSLDLM